MHRVPIAWYAKFYCSPLSVSFNTKQAEGRDSEEAILPNTYRYSREIFVPQLENGFLQYSIFQIIAAGDSGWAIKDLPCVVFPTSTGPSAAGGITAMDGVDAQKMSQSGFQASADRE